MFHLHSIQKLFRCLSLVGRTDFFDRLENFLYQSTRCLCYNLFHGDVPHFRSFLLWLTNFTTKGASPLFLFAAPPPAGGGAPACRRIGARYFSQNYFTLTSLTLYGKPFSEFGSLKANHSQMKEKPPDLGGKMTAFWSEVHLLLESLFWSPLGNSSIRMFRHSPNL